MSAEKAVVDRPNRKVLLSVVEIGVEMTWCANSRKSPLSGVES